MEMLFGWRGLQSRAAKQDRGRPMDSTVRDLLLIILFGLAEAFMVWKLWNFYKAGQRRRAPVVSSQNLRTFRAPSFHLLSGERVESDEPRQAA